MRKLVADCRGLDQRCREKQKKFADTTRQMEHLHEQIKVITDSRKGK